MKQVVIHGESELLVLNGVHATVLVEGPRLAAVDVVESPHVRELDLRGCAPGLHLVVRDCPSLERVFLPDRGDGATLHLDFSDRAPRLDIRGLVADLDLCWVDGAELRSTGAPHGREGRGPLAGASIGAAPGPEAELVILAGDTRPDLVLFCAREVVLVRAAAVTATVDTRHPRVIVEANGCPDLRALRSSHRLHRVRVDACPAFAELDASGRVATLANGSSEVDLLEVRGSWSLLQLRYAGPKALHAGLAEEIAVGQCPRLERIRAMAGAEIVAWGVGAVTVEGGARLVFEPLSDKMLDEALAAMDDDDEAQGGLVNWAAGRKDPRAVLRAIQVLRSIARKGHDPTHLWAVRCALHERSARPGEAWAWRFPEDLGSRGWAADVGLWLYCRRAVPAAAAFGDVMARHSDPIHLAAIAGAARTEPEVDDLLALLVDALSYGAREGSPLPVAHRRHAVDGVPPRVMDDLGSVLQTLVVLRRHPLAPRVAQALCDWIVQRLPCDEGMHLLGAMRVMGSRAAGGALGHVIVSPLRYGQRVCRVALMQTLAPIRDTALAFEEAPHAR